MRNRGSELVYRMVSKPEIEEFNGNPLNFNRM
jgi:hypothetical protein